MMIRSLKLNCAAVKPKIDSAIVGSPVLTGKLSQIEEQLYVGNYEAACNLSSLKREGITHIINCSPANCTNLYEDKFAYQNVDIKDEVNCDIGLLVILSITFINDVIANGGKVMVHCSQGISRAPSIVLGYLIWKKRISVDDALQFLREKHEIADPNLGFLLQLQNFSKLVNCRDNANDECEANIDKHGIGSPFSNSISDDHESNESHNSNEGTQMDIEKLGEDVLLN